MSRAAMQQALDALTAKPPANMGQVEAIEILRSALDAQAKPLPPAGSPVTETGINSGSLENVARMFVATQGEPTDAQILECARAEGDEDRSGFIFNKDGHWSVLTFARAVLALRTPQPAAAPLTEPELEALILRLMDTEGANLRNVARAIERAHGIKRGKHWTHLGDNDVA